MRASANASQSGTRSTNLATCLPSISSALMSNLLISAPWEPPPLSRGVPASPGHSEGPGGLGGPSRPPNTSNLSIVFPAHEAVGPDDEDEKEDGEADHLLVARTEEEDA